MGVSKAFFQASGTWWDDRDSLKTFWKAGAINEESSQRTMGKMQSGPAALCGFWLFNSLVIPAVIVVIEIGVIDSVLLEVWSQLQWTLCTSHMRQKHLGGCQTMQWGKKQWDYIIQKANIFFFLRCHCIVCPPARCFLYHVTLYKHLMQRAHSWYCL